MNRRIKKLLPFLAALILALVLELLLFNWKAVFSGRQDWTSLPEPKVSGDLAEDKSVAFFFYDLDRDVSWCHLDLQVRDKDGRPVQTALTVNVSDEGNERIYTAGEVAYFPGHEKASYFHLNTYGKVHHLTLVLRAPEEGCTWTLRAAEINAEIIFKATNVDGVYDKDPNKFPDAVKYDTLTHSEILQKGLAVMDATAASLCRDNGISILVFNLADPENIVRAVKGENVGTVVSE